MAQAPEPCARRQGPTHRHRHRDRRPGCGERPGSHRVRRRELTRVYRILRKRYAKTPFDGEGAYRYGGRWASPGIRLAYASEHLSLAMIEYFVHLDRDDPPPDLLIAAAVGRA